MSIPVDHRLVEILREAAQELEKAEEDRRRAEVLLRLRSDQVVLLEERLSELRS